MNFRSFDRYLESLNNNLRYSEILGNDPDSLKIDKAPSNPFMMKSFEPASSLILRGMTKRPLSSKLCSKLPKNIFTTFSHFLPLAP